MAIVFTPPIAMTALFFCRIFINMVLTGEAAGLYELARLSIQTIAIASTISFIFMLLVGLPAILILEKFRFNGIFAYLASSSLIGFLMGFPFNDLFASPGEETPDLWTFTIVAGFSCGLVSYFIIHFDTKIRLFRVI